MARPRSSWTEFRAYFELAENEGIDLIVAAEELLKGIRARSRSLKIAGLRRQWEMPSEAEQREWRRADIRWQELARAYEDLPETSADERGIIEAELKNLRSFLDTKYDWRERLPRDPQLRQVPKSIWGPIAEVKQDLTSIWLDDPEEPEQFIKVEWLPGSIKSQDWFEYEAYEGLCIDGTQARELIKLLSGKTDLRGAPPGPRSEETRLAVEGVLAAIAEGDARDIGKIAWDFIPKDVARTEKGTLMNRQVKRHVKARLQGAKNASPE